MAETESNAFWTFTLESYPSRGGPAGGDRACKTSRGADVNLLFFCCYVADERARPSGPMTDFAAADAALEPWRRQVTLPLRALRDH